MMVVTRQESQWVLGFSNGIFETMFGAFAVSIALLIIVKTKTTNIVGCLSVLRNIMNQFRRCDDYGDRKNVDM